MQNDSKIILDAKTSGKNKLKFSHLLRKTLTYVYITYVHNLNSIKDFATENYFLY